MNIVYSASDSYSPLAGISLLSLLMNNKHVNELNVYIVDNGISDENKSKLEKICNDYSRTLEFVSLPDELYNYNINIQKWNISTFGRLFEASVLPQLDRVIHVDCDTVVTGSLKEIWEMDMENSVVAGAVDCVSDSYKANLSLKTTDTYINAGLVMLNLSRIRELKLENTFREYIEKNSGFLRYVDQEVLNACVPQNEKLTFSLKYNSYSIIHHFDYKNLRRLRRASEYSLPENEYYEARNTPVVVHYTSCFMEGLRPWIEGDTHPLNNLFYEYKSLSPWNDMPLWKDTRGGVKKLVTKLVNIAPLCLVVMAVGFVHGAFLPWTDKIKRCGR